MIKVMIVDDQLIFRDCIRYTLEQYQDISVPVTAGDGMEALKLCDSEVPDVILMDIKMPNCDGVEGTKIIKAKYPNVKIIVLTTFNNDETVKNALANGAEGYILKSVSSLELVNAIKTVYQGLPIIHQEVLQTIVKNINTDISQTSIVEYDLNNREIDIVKLVVEGKSNKEIGNILFLSEGRIKNIITELLGKLNLEDRLQLAVFAVKNRIC